MNSRIDIQRELEGNNSSLPFNVPLPVFDLPTGYFENFAAVVLAKIKAQTADAAGELAELSPLLAGISKQNPYSLPDHYFSQIFAPGPGREEEPLPGWGAEGRNTPYSVPAGYFEQLPARLLEAAAPGPAKVVSLFSRNWVRYAAAAVVTGLLVLGGLRYQTSTAPGAHADPSQWLDNSLSGVSNKELDAFIYSTDIGLTEGQSPTASAQGEVRKLLKDLPSSELDAFLSEVPAGAEMIN